MFRDKYLLHLIVIISFFSDPFIWLMVITKDDRLISVALIFLSFVFLIRKKVLAGPRDYAWFGSWLLVFLYIFLHGFFLGDTTQIVQSFGYLFKMLFLVVVVYALKKDFPKLLNLFFQYNIVVMYASVALFFLLAVGIELPSIEFSQGTFGALLDKNWLYPLGIIMDKTSIGPFTFARISGLTDEPGQLALLITWLLVLNEFTLKSKKYRKNLIICGIFTFSLGFVISITLIGIYLLIVEINKPVLIIKNSIIIMLLVLLVFSVIGESPLAFIDNKIFSRLKFSNDQRSIIVGDNRSMSIIDQYSELKSNKRLIFGYGVTESQKRALGRDFATYGLISLFLRYIPFYLLLFKNSNKYKVLLLLTILVNFFQRPGIHFIAQMMCLTFIYYSPMIRYYYFQRSNVSTIKSC